MQLDGRLRRDELDRLVDVLRISAVIESRSSERSRLLAARVKDEARADFDRSLLACERRHHGSHVELTAQRISRADLDSRWCRLAEHEAEIIRCSRDRVRLHAG